MWESKDLEIDNFMKRNQRLLPEKQMSDVVLFLNAHDCVKKNRIRVKFR